jgi:hypothetical protein
MGEAKGVPLNFSISSWAFAGLCFAVCPLSIPSPPHPLLTSKSLSPFLGSSLALVPLPSRARLAARARFHTACAEARVSGYC